MKAWSKSSSQVVVCVLFQRELWGSSQFREVMVARAQLSLFLRKHRLALTLIADLFFIVLS